MISVHNGDDVPAVPAELQSSDGDAGRSWRVAEKSVIEGVYAASQGGKIHRAAFERMDEDDQERVLEIVADLRNAVGGGGAVTTEDLVNALTKLQSIQQMSLSDSSMLEYKTLPPKLQQALCSLDTDRKGAVECADIARAAVALEAHEQQNGFMRKVIIALIAVFVLLLIAMISGTFLVIEATKDFRLDDHGHLQTRGGEPVQVESSSFVPDECGRLVTRGDSDAQGPNGCSENRTAIKTSVAHPTLPTLRRDSGRRLHDGRRLVEALGIEDLAEEYYMDVASVESVDSSFRHGETQWVFNGEDESLQVSILGYQKLDPDGEEDLLHLLVQDAGSGQSQLLVLCPAEGNGTECVVLLPKLTKQDFQQGLVPGSNLSADASSSRRLPLPLIAVFIGVKLGAVVVSATFPIIIREGFDHANDESRRRGGCFPGDSRLALWGGLDEHFTWVNMTEVLDGQNVLTGWGSDGLHAEPVLTELHTREENRKTATFTQLTHEHGIFEATGNHFVQTVEHGMVPVGVVVAGEHIYALPMWAANASSIAGGVALLPSRVLSQRLVNKTGLFSKLTYSGRLLVNGVLASSYTMDEVDTYLPDKTKKAALIDKMGYDGIHSLVHAVAFPLRAFHVVAPASWRSSPSWAPHDGNALESATGDGLPLFVDFAGRLLGSALDLVL